MADERFSVESLPASGDEVGRALVLPGGGYTVDHPLLFWSCQALRAGGWRVQAMRWTVDEAAMADRRAFVEAGADVLDESAGPAGRTLVVGKSLGSLACGWAAQHGYPGIWLTPLLTEEFVVQTLSAGGSDGLLVGGTADRLWRHDAAVTSGLDVVEVPGADHALHVGTDWRASLAALERAMSAVEAFAARIAAS